MNDHRQETARIQSGSARGKSDGRVQAHGADQVIPRGYLRRNAAAAYLGISPRTLSVWQSRRLVPFIKVSHKVCLFRIADLDEALSRLTTKAVS